MLYVTKNDSYFAKIHQITYSVFKNFAGVTPPNSTSCCDLEGHQKDLFPGATNPRYAPEYGLVYLRSHVAPSSQSHIVMWCCLVTVEFSAVYTSHT